MHTPACATIAWSRRSLRVGDKRFRDADTNKDGLLSEKEFTAMLRLPAGDRRIRERLIAEYLKKYDRNGDKIITAEEAAEKWKTIEELDANHDRKLTRDELARAPEMHNRRRFEEIDRNHDGQIDFTEFALWWRTLPSLAAR